MLSASPQSRRAILRQLRLVTRSQNGRSSFSSDGLVRAQKRQESAHPLEDVLHQPESFLVQIPDKGYILPAGQQLGYQASVPETGGLAPPSFIQVHTLIEGVDSREMLSSTSKTARICELMPPVAPSRTSHQQLIKPFGSAGPSGRLLNTVGATRRPASSVQHLSRPQMKTSSSELSAEHLAGHIWPFSRFDFDFDAERLQHSSSHLHHLLHYFHLRSRLHQTCGSRHQGKSNIDICSV